ncbi:hypothetical protein B0G84_1015 [Paraburkholderia sp. BL8N3]|nr:hypothetical protein B0G84_1015 [Paraburkholderia sp. BL8N3]
MNSSHYGVLLTHLLAVFDRTVRALDGALLLARHKNGTQE